MVKTNKLNVNEMIRTKEVRLIDDNGDQMGILPIDEALSHARRKGLDLVEVSPNSNPPVCRVLDYGKFKYQLNKKSQEAKKKQSTIQLKEVKFRPKTDEHDYQVKLSHIKRFLAQGDKAKVSVMFKGREITHAELGDAMLKKVAADIKDFADIEQSPRLESKTLIMILAPKK